MKKDSPLQATRKRSRRKLRTAKAQLPSTCQTDDEEGMVAIQLEDGTWKTVSGKNLEVDIEYRDRVPYLVARARQ
jgi:chaperone required for assembly of F1-ATPase